MDDRTQVGPSHDASSHETDALLNTHILNFGGNARVRSLWRQTSSRSDVKKVKAKMRLGTPPSALILARTPELSPLRRDHLALEHWQRQLLEISNFEKTCARLN